MTVHVTTGDTQPLLSLNLYKDEAGTQPLDLTTARSVVWHIAHGATDVVKAATISDATNGVTKVQWDGDSSITPATWDVRAVITWDDNSLETTINSEKLAVHSAA